MIKRRSFMLFSAGLFSGSYLLADQQATKPDTSKPADNDQAEDWACPMDPDVRSKQPGSCPRCGMRLVLHIPERREYELIVTHEPSLLRPNEPMILKFRAIDPDSGKPVRKFELVHEKLIHLFVVSENLEYFAHVHPVFKDDGTFELGLRLPQSGMYRLLADFYPSGSVPQLAVETLFVTGPRPTAHLQPSLGEAEGTNLKARLAMDPERPIAGLETKLFFTLEPGTGLETYLGAWGHMLAASEDLIDLIHIHPFIADGGPRVQFNAIFPRAGLYRIWTQFQRKDVVNTVVFTVPVTSL
jgi:hypothetical protein